MIARRFNIRVRSDQVAQLHGAAETVGRLPHPAQSILAQYVRRYAVDATCI